MRVRERRIFARRKIRCFRVRKAQAAFLVPLPPFATLNRRQKAARFSRRGRAQKKKCLHKSRGFDARINVGCHVDAYLLSPGR